MKRALSFLIWAALAILGAVGYAVVAFQRGEPVNSGYLLLAAVCTYAIGYRFYSKWIAARILTLDDLRATPAKVQRGRQGFREDEQVDRVRPPFRGHRRAGAAGRAGAGGAVRLPAGRALDAGRRGAGRRGAGQSSSSSARCAGGQVARADGEARRSGPSPGSWPSSASSASWSSCSRCWRWWWSTRWRRARGACSPSPRRCRSRSSWAAPALRRRERQVAAGACSVVVALLVAVWGGQFVHGTALEGWLHAEGHDAGVVDHGLRPARLDFAGVAAARAARLPEHVHEDRHGDARSAVAIVALPDLKMPALTKFIDGTGPVVAGKLVPVRLHHHRLRGGLGLPLAHRLGHDAQAAGARESHPGRRLRRDGDWRWSWHHGADRRLRDGAGRVFEP
jgi:carbon starvation protein